MLSRAKKADMHQCQTLDACQKSDNFDHRGFYRSRAVIFGYRRDFASTRENQRLLCVISAFERSIADVGL